MPWVPRDGELFPSLGWHVADQMSEYLASPAKADFEPFNVTREQLEFLVRLYELDPVTGRRVKHRAVLQRPRGWGKSPFLAGIGISEALFEVVFDGWDANGQPVARPWSSILTPLVLVTAVSEDQVANTWTPLLEMLRNGSVVDEFGVDPMDTFVSLRSGRIEPRTSSGRAIKGAPGQVAAIMDQTEEWVKGNGGTRLAQNLRNNATKTGGLTLESPNAFTPGELSVAEESSKFWEFIKAGKIKRLDENEVRSLLYDHREAPPATDPGDSESLIAGLRVAYGDSSDHPDGCVIHDPPCPPGWAPIGRIAMDFYDTSNDPQVMRADFLNQITHASNSYVSQPELRAIVNDDKVISPREPIVLGFDGSEGRKPGSGVADSTVLIGFSVTQQHGFELGVWEQPKGPAGDGWRPPALEIETKVDEVFKKYNVVGFFGDPSAGWAGQVKTWESKYHPRLKVYMTKDEPIKWKQKEISRTVEGFEQLRSAITGGDITISGSALVAHLLHARRDPRRNGYVLKKPDDDQDNSKIDAAWGLMFAFVAGLEALGKGITSDTRTAPRRIR